MQEVLQNLSVKENSLDSNKLNVLILPDLFPRYRGDWIGVFVIDYIKSVLPFTNAWVFYSKITGEEKGVREEEFEDGIKVYRWNYKRRLPSILKPLLYPLWMLKTVSKITSLNNKTDIIHAHGAILNGTIAFLLSKRLSIPYIISEHTGPFSKISNSYLKKTWAKFILNNANCVLAVSNHLKGEMVEIGVKESKVRVSYNPVDTSIFNLPSLAVSSKKILFVSRLEPFKGGLRALKAFHKFYQIFNDWTFCLCGEGNERKEIEQYVKENNLESSVELKPSLTKTEISKEFHQASFFVFPSLHESFGLIAAEALSTGLAVISTNKTAMPEYIHKGNGILLKESSVDEIYEAMIQMKENTLKYHPEEISSEINERFGIKQFGKRMSVIYTDLISQKLTL